MNGILQKYGIIRNAFEQLPPELDICLTCCDLEMRVIFLLGMNLKIIYLRYQANLSGFDDLYKDDV